MARIGSFTPVLECTQVSARTRVRGFTDRRTADTTSSAVTVRGFK
jgi:hypothetical protein